MRPEGLGKLKKKINSSHLVSNSRPFGLQHCALTPTVPQSWYFWDLNRQHCLLFGTVLLRIENHVTD
jgi:hypothetical protein